MPTFELSGPDGAAYHVDAPDAAAALDAFHSFVAAPPAPDIGDNRASTLAALRGVPIAGAYADKAAAALNAAAQPFTETGLSHADNFSDRMAENENTLKAGTDAFEKTNPVGTTVGKLAVGAAAMAPAIAMAPEALGVAGGFGARTLMGGLSNAAIGGADALTRGSNPLSGAVIGGALGAAAPAVGAVASEVASPFISRIMGAINPEGYARRQVARAIAESGRSTGDIAADVTSAAAEGQPQFNVADSIGNSGQRLLSSVARAPGAGRTAVVDALEGRQAGQGRRIANALAEGFDAPETAAQTEARLTAARGADADAAYGAVRNDAGPVDVTGAIDHIDQTLGPAANQMLANPGSAAANDSVESVLQTFRNRLARVNPDDFASVQRIRGDMADAAQNAMQSGYGNRARLIRGAIGRLDTAMENASAGHLAANRNFAQASRNIDAVQTGRDAFNRGRTEDVIPAFQNLTPEGQAAFRSGYVDPAIAQTQGAAFGANKARPLINSAFQDEAAAMAPGNPLMQRRIGREQTMFTTRNQALGNSKTAENLADEAALGIEPSTIGHIVTGNYGAAVGSLIRAGVRGVTGNTAPVREAVANILLRHGATVTGPALDSLVGQTVRRLQLMQTLARSGSRAAAGAVATTVNAKNQRPPVFANRKASQ